MSNKIMNRLPESRIQADYKTKIQNPSYLDGDTSDDLKLTKGSGEDICTPIHYDWFSVNLIDPTTRNSASVSIPPVYLYGEDDFYNMNTEDSKNYLARFLRVNSPIRLNHLLNLPTSVKNLIERKQLQSHAVQSIMATLLAQEILLRIINPKVSTPVERGEVIRNPVNYETLNNIVFKELFAHKLLITKDMPNYLKSLLGLDNGKRYTTKSGVVYDMFIEILSSTELIVEQYRKSTIGNFAILDLNKGIRVDSNSAGEAQVISLTPKSVFANLPPIGNLFHEAERINSLWNLLKSQCATHDVSFGSLDQLVDDRGMGDCMPRKTLYSTNPMYGKILNRMLDETRVDIFNDKPYNISGRLRVLATLMDSELFKFEISTNHHSSDPWNGVRKLKGLNGLSYSQRYNGNSINVHPFISPYLQHLLWIVVMINSKDLPIRNNNSSWVGKLSEYLKYPGVSDVKGILTEALVKMTEIADFIESTTEAMDFYKLGDSVAPKDTGLIIDGLDIVELIEQIPVDGLDVTDRSLNVGDFLLSNLS